MLDSFHQSGSAVDDATHKHAAASLSNGNSYTYDQNGNMITRHVGTETLRQAQCNAFNFAYDAENRLVTVSGDASGSARFLSNVSVWVR
jgi:hypothetical protein